MGQSIILVKKEFLELTVEIDREIDIEISTGFLEGQHRARTGTSIPVSIEELEEMAKLLSTLISDLKESWKCPDCGAINRKERQECNTCDYVQPASQGK